MRLTALLLALVASSSVVVVCHASSMIHVHDCSGRHILPGVAAPKELTSPAAAANVAAALAGLVPAQLDKSTANELGAVLAPRRGGLDRVRALVLLNVAGLGDSGLDALADALPSEGASTARVRVAPGADGVVGAQARLAAANRDVRFRALDEAALREAEGGCDDACVTEHLHDAAQRMGGILEPSGAGAALLLPGGGSIALARPAGRLFAAELGALHGAAKAAAAAAAAKARSSSSSSSSSGGGNDDSDAAADDDVAVFHAALVGPQVLADAAAAAGEDAEAAAAAAAEALAGVVRGVAAQLAAAFGHDTAYVVSALGRQGGSGSGSSGGSEDDEGAALASWKREARRLLMQEEQEAAAELYASPAAADAPDDAPDVPAAAGTATEADAKAFSTAATSFGVALLLVYVLGAVLYAMATMPFKQDTLLWGRPKAE